MKGDCTERLIALLLRVAEITPTDEGGLHLWSSHLTFTVSGDHPHR